MNFVVVEDVQGADVEPPKPEPSVRRVRQVGDMVSAISSQRTSPVIANPSDRRWALRKRCETPAFIAHSKNPQGIRCIVRDTSSSGALIEVSNGSDRFGNPAEEIPDRLTLVFISYRERTEVACVVLRRAGRMIGVRYVGPFRSFPAPAPASKLVPAGKKR